MKSRAFRPTAALLCILLFAGTPVLAGPVVVSEVVQVLSGYQNPVSLRLQNSHQNSNVAYVVGESRVDGLTGTESDDSSDISDTPGTLLSGISDLEGQKVGIDIVDQDEVDGTICDCGEIFVAGAAFDKWPFFFLAAVPLIFIPRDDHNPEIPTPTPIPTPPVPTRTPAVQPVPEPATLLLFGSGLAAIGASLRRRRKKGQSKSQAATEEG